ncbi:histidine phosphatase family protein [Roseivirga sp. BDSF3-8]|uniref:histidine phosphatase family protein n=1 Tax=Roseivirga sp. BDSF3-8 TaxID=3241598 RepID=UPI003531D681
MKSKKIYLVRHGQTEYNRKGIVQGSGIDAPLNDTGKEQARRFYQAYSGVPFDKVYTSYLRRTMESVSGFLEDGLPHEKLAGLNEIHWGSKEGKPFTPDDHDEYLRIVDCWRNGDYEACIEGGESPTQVRERLNDALEHILANENEEKILICMHGRAMRVFLCLMLNYDLCHMDMFEHDNLCLYKLVYTGSLFQLEHFNDRRHLVTPEEVKA